MCGNKYEVDPRNKENDRIDFRQHLSQEAPNRVERNNSDCLKHLMMRDHQTKKKGFPSLFLVLLKIVSSFERTASRKSSVILIVFGSHFFFFPLTSPLTMFKECFESNVSGERKVFRREK